MRVWTTTPPLWHWYLRWHKALRHRFQHWP